METVRSLSSGTNDEFAKLTRRLNSPGVVVDNKTSISATVILVNSNKSHGILLKVVQLITDLNLIIKKAYIASDGGWFMDVFYVTDEGGSKIIDQGVLDYIRNMAHRIFGSGSGSSVVSGSCQALAQDSSIPDSTRSVDLKPRTDHTTIELIGSDRPGLLSDVSAVLTDLGCNIVSGEVWTHNHRVASVIHFTDANTGSAISDPSQLSNIKKLIGQLLKSSDESQDAKAAVSDVGHPARRLHQMMFDDRDYEWPNQDEFSEDGEKELTRVDIGNWQDKGYTFVMIRSKDRPKLLFDTLCTLTDMGYVVFHANIDAEGPEAYQEYYIRHRDGQPVKTDMESQRLKLCLRAAIKRRVSEGLKLELCTTDRVGLLAEVTRIFRENGLTVSRAEVTTNGGRVMNTFYVRNGLGCPIDSGTIDSIREAIGKTVLQVKGGPEEETKTAAQGSNKRFLLFSRWNFPSLIQRIMNPRTVSGFDWVRK